MPIMKIINVLVLLSLVNRITFDELTDAKCNIESDEVLKEVMVIIDKARSCIYDRMEYFKVL